MIRSMKFNSNHNETNSLRKHLALVPLRITSEEGMQKFHTDDVSLPSCYSMAKPVVVLQNVCRLFSKHWTGNRICTNLLLASLLQTCKNGGVKK